MDLRDETREVEQVRWALSGEEHVGRARPLEKSQDQLGQRVEKVVVDIRALPSGEEDFGREIALLLRVTEVMSEAEGLLGRPETGPVAVAAETEAIELLLQSRRSRGGGGGAGGSPGRSNSGGDTDIPALALIGRGTAENAKIEDRVVSHAAGAALPEFPEEYRRGLEALFNDLEKGQ